MSTRFPRTVTFTRPGAETGVGFQTAYSGDVVTTETAIAGASSPVAANIQPRVSSGGAGRQSQVGLPSDAAQTTWMVFLPRNCGIQAGVLKSRDIVTDDLGGRYQISGAYWNFLGWRLTTLRLEA